MIHLQNPQNVAEYLSAAATQQPNVTAMHVPKGRGRRRRYTQVSYAELDQRSDHIALGLSSAGISRGDRVALMVKPSIELFALTFGLFKAGVVPVIVDPGIGIKPLKECLKRAAPTGFIGIPSAHAARVALGLAKDSVRHRVMVGPKIGFGSTLASVESAGKNARAKTNGLVTQKDDTAAILFTSGSTGVPKGVVYQHKQFLAQVDALQSLFDFAPGEVDLPTFPLFALFDPALGMTTVVPYMDATKPASVDPSEIIDPIQRFSVTTMFGSPALLNTVGRYGDAHATKLPSLKRIIAAGAPLPAQTMKRWHKMMHSDGLLYPPYGATECLPIACLSSKQILSETWEKTQEGAGVCVGKPVDSIDLRVIEISDAPLQNFADVRELPRGEIGEIVVSGPMVTERYCEDKANTDLHKIVDGGKIYHRVGDVGYLDEQGRVWFCGRKSHRVQLDDRVLFTVPHEKRFDVHPQVYRSALVGITVSGHRRAVLCVELEPGANKARVQKDLRDIADANEETQIISGFLFHDSFPVDIRHNAKIGREKLSIWAATQPVIAKAQQ